MKQLILIMAMLFGTLCFGCAPEASPTPGIQTDSTAEDTVIHATYDVSTLPVSDLFKITHTQPLKADSLKEISGLAASSAVDNSSLWSEEDSGNKNAIYLLDSLGNLTGIKYLPGTLNLDWEDLSAGPGPDQGKHYLYIGDIGDNLKIRPFITIYRLEEPNLHTPQDTVVKDFDIINLVYPDGPHNAEAMMVDPATKFIYVITKDTAAGLYAAPYPQNASASTKLILLETLPISSVTAADISGDGNQILIKNYDDIFYWKKNAGETLINCLQRTPLRLHYKRELQGESIAWTHNGKGFFTLSEQVGAHIPILYHYEIF